MSGAYLVQGVMFQVVLVLLHDDVRLTLAFVGGASYHGDRVLLLVHVHYDTILGELLLDQNHLVTGGVVGRGGRV